MKMKALSNYESILHPIAAKPEDAHRLTPLIDEEDSTAWRSSYARDRHRITNCKAFRRLAHKTQVYLTTKTDDHRRTRLTHTYEVASIARDIARNLHANEDLVEAISLGHDIGHAPFGHAGERQLNDFLKSDYHLPRILTERMPKFDPRKPRAGGFGFFKHNYQSVRLLSLLENYIPDQYGLNLSVQCLEGIFKHTTTLKMERGKAVEYGFPEELEEYLFLNQSCSATLEGQIVAVADEIAQVAHDLSDAIDNGSIQISDILDDCQELSPAFTTSLKLVEKNDGLDNTWYLCQGSEANNQVAPIIIRHFASIAAETMNKNLEKIRSHRFEPMGLREWLLPEGTFPCKEFRTIKDYKDDIVINNYKVNRMDNRGKYLIRQLIEAYINDARQMPDEILSGYITMKQKCLRENGVEFCKDWFSLVENELQLDSDHGLKENEAGEIIDLLKIEAIDGKAFRRMKHDLLRKLTSYLIADGDYRRVIVDHIASMSDSNAEKEVASLYT